MVLFLLTVLFSIQAHATRYYVTETGSGNNNGLSWNNAFIGLQAALDVAVSGDEIWVAGGIYKPTEPPRNATEFDGITGFDDNKKAVFTGY